MRRLLSAVLAAGACAAQASFELALVADNNLVGYSVGRIHRYDPATGAYLGSFGENVSPYTDIVVNPSTGRLYALDSAALLTEFDYSTGLALRSRSNVVGTNLALSPNGNELYVLSGLSINRLAISSLLSAGTISLATTYGQPLTVQMIGTNLYAICLLYANTYVTVRYSLSGSIVQTSGGYSYSTAPTRLGYTVGADANVPYYLMAGHGTGSQMFLSPVNSSGNVGTPGFYTPSGGQLWQDVAPLHTGGLLVGQYAADPTKGVVCVTSGTGAVFRSFGTGQLKNPVAVATVVTPEPASLGVLGLGLSLVWRRRRQ